jgi:hypothetical protein
LHCGRLISQFLACSDFVERFPGSVQIDLDVAGFPLNWIVRDAGDGVPGLLNIQTVPWYELNRYGFSRAAWKRKVDEDGMSSEVIWNAPESGFSITMAKSARFSRLGRTLEFLFAPPAPPSFGVRVQSRGLRGVRLI